MMSIVCCNSPNARAGRALCVVMLSVLLLHMGAGLVAAWGVVPFSRTLGATVVYVMMELELVCRGGRRALLGMSFAFQLVCGVVHVLDGVWQGCTSPWGPWAASVCAGAALGAAVSTSLFYVAETSDPARRGARCCLSLIASLAGRFLHLLVQGYLSPVNLALFGLVPGALGVLLLFLAAPSPYFLALRGGGGGNLLLRALVRLRGLRDQDAAAAREEAEEIVNAVRQQESGRCGCGGNFRGPILALLLCGTAPLMGAPFIDARLARFVESLFSPQPVDMQIVVACSGLVQGIAVLACVLLVDLVGRRPLLIFGSALLAYAHFTLGYFWFFVGEPRPPAPSHIDLAGHIRLGALGTISFASTIVTTIVWVFLAETTPMSCKAYLPLMVFVLDEICTFFLGAVSGVLIFLGVITEETPLFIAIWMWSFCLWAVMLCVAIIRAIPETYGYTLGQIHEIFRGPNRETRQTHL